MLENEKGKKPSKIESLKKGLYSKTGNFLKRKPKLHAKKYNVNTEWGNESLSDLTANNELPVNDKTTKNKMSLLEKTLIVGIVLFILSTGAVLLNIFGGVNRVSTENVDISVIGPASVESGGEASFQITIENNNATDLELADLVVTYPRGTRSIDNEELSKYKESLDVIPAGKSIRKEVKAVLYGEENSERSIVISLEYRIAGSNAIFFKENSYNLVISSSPINLVVSPIESSVSGQEIEFSVSVVSNTNTPTEDLILVADYPFGFEFVDATPKPNLGDNIWYISNNEQVINIKGIVSGQEGEERVLKFTCGTKSESDEKVIGAIFALAEKSLTIERPFLGIDLAVNGEDSQDYILSPGSPVRLDILWKNNSPAKILDGEIVVKLVGDIINKYSISVDRGFYRSSDNSVVWDARTSGELSEINPGDEGRYSLYFELLDIGSRVSFKNPEIHVDVSASGNRVFEQGVPEDITSNITRKISVSSDLMVNALATYLAGPFVNSGPLPPKVDQETTYTITWVITNSMNDVTNTRVMASLPPYVRWMGVVSPSTENISYNPIGGEIIWNAGEIKAGTGSKTAPREISFQVALLPSLSQLGVVPILVNGVTVTGVDRFTSEVLQGEDNAVSTKISTDPGFSNIKAVVTQ